MLYYSITQHKTAPVNEMSFSVWINRRGVIIIRPDVLQHAFVRHLLQHKTVVIMSIRSSKNKYFNNSMFHRADPVQTQY